VSRSTWGTSRLCFNFADRALTVSGGPFHTSSAIVADTTSRPRNPRMQASEFGLFPVRSPLLRESLSLSFPRVTEMFHFTRFGIPGLCIHPGITRHDSGWVSPFGNLRIKACLPLPGAYRSLLRPSSPSGAKAFTVRPF
jgi:hypothetical protein